MRFRMLTAGLLASMVAGQSSAVNIVLDYSYDLQDFFGAGNPDGAVAGAKAKATLEKVASDLTEILTDSFSAVSAPPTYFSDADGQASPVEYTWDWDITFSNPGVNGGPTVTIEDPSFAANEYRIYAGGRSIGGSTLGIGGPGGDSFSNGGSWYLPSEKAEIDVITAEFENQRNRGQASGFASWGGSITFDNDGSTTWNYDWQTDPVPGQSDLYSVAIHEILHALGWGTSSEWSAIAAGGFDGPAAVTEYGGVVPVNGGHWAEGTMSNILRDGDEQETALDPNITNGTRKVLTDLDVAALDDIGWDIDYTWSYSGGIAGDFDGDGDVDGVDIAEMFSNFNGPGGGVPSNPATDLDGDGDVDGVDIATLFGAFTGPLAPANVPEPGSIAVLGLAGLLTARRRHR